MILLDRINKLMEEQQNVLVAIDGGSASGKTTLAVFLMELYHCNVFHMDDFFLQLHQRTIERLEEPGGNVDYERFYKEVLTPLKEGKEFTYSPYSCKTQTLENAIKVKPKQLNIIDGAYSMHPMFADTYDISVFIKIKSNQQKARILERNGAKMYKRFVNEWIPMENKYFTKMNIPEKCDFIFEGFSLEKK